MTKNKNQAVSPATALGRALNIVSRGAGRSARLRGCQMYPHKVQCNYIKEHPMTNMRVGTRELKSKLSEYLRRVKAGETIIVTEHGKTIGQITPVKPTLEKRMKALVESGAAEWNGKKYRPKKPAAQNRGRKQVSDLVIEDRDGHPLS